MYPLELAIIDEAITTQSMQLYQNQPNPFQATTTIGFYLPKKETLQFTIYDALGTTIKLVEGSYSKGMHTIELSTSMLPTGGLYYYTLAAGDKRLSKKMLVIQR